ncbi:MAG: thiamine diphosphokinase [Christensenellales bacterium]
MRALVIAGGQAPSPALVRRYADGAGLIVCADRGYLAAQAARVIPDLVVGDFDSMERPQLEGVQVQCLPVMKDMTDTQAAVDLCIERGAREVVLLGASGTRLDHTLANLLLLVRLETRGARGLLVDAHNRVRAVRGTVALDLAEGTLFSLLPLGAGVTVGISGAVYPLEQGFPLTLDNPLGVSNVARGGRVTLELAGGWALLILATDAPQD